MKPRESNLNDLADDDNNNSRKWIIQVPSAIPNEENPYGGIFTKAHIDSVNQLVNQKVYYAYSLPMSINKGLPFHEEYMIKVSQLGDETEYLIVVRRYKRSPGWQLRSFVDFFSWVFKYRKQIKLLHAHGAFWGGIWCVIVGEILHIPVIITEHSSAFPLSKFPWFMRVLLRCFLPLADAILPVTSNLGSFINLYAPRVPQYVIPNCVDGKYFQPSPMPGTNKFKILFVGSFIEEKNIALLLHALARMPISNPFTVTLAGVGPLYDEMRELADRLGLANANFVGLLSRERLRDELRNCHVLVLSSHWESQPCVLIESMLSGRPVIAPIVGGIPEMVDESCGILYKRDDETDLFESLQKMANDVKRYDPNCIAIRIRERFSYETIGQALKSIYYQYAHP